MTPDQKMFVLRFVKQLHTCIEKHGVANGAAGLIVNDSRGVYSAGVSDNQQVPQVEVPHTDVVKK